MTKPPLSVNTNNTVTGCRLQDASCGINDRTAPFALPCDAWHHYYHYQSSAQYLWLAKTLQILGKEPEAAKAYEKALFQDHFNQQALEAKAGRADTNPADYSKHPHYDTEFRISIGEEADNFSQSHDEAVNTYIAGQYDTALTTLVSRNNHSNSRFLAGKCLFALERYDEAKYEFAEAIRLSHIRHDAYHRYASEQHLSRGKQWLDKGDIDLAVNDFTKALDLHSQNKEARKARALAYKTKGNLKLAMEDESMA